MSSQQHNININNMMMNSNNKSCCVVYSQDIPPYLQISSNDIIVSSSTTSLLSSLSTTQKGGGGGGGGGGEEADAAAGGGGGGGGGGSSNNNSSSNNNNEGDSILKRVSSFSIMSRVTSTNSISSSAANANAAANAANHHGSSYEESDNIMGKQQQHDAIMGGGGGGKLESSSSSNNIISKRKYSIENKNQYPSKNKMTAAGIYHTKNNYEIGRGDDSDNNNNNNNNNIVPSWRLRDRMKTVGVGLVMALNVGTDPPDIIKPHPCAKLQTWMDPASVTRAKAKEKIGERLESQYARWQQQRAARPLKYRRALDPTVEDVRTLCLWLRRQARQERILLHYNGHGVPRPTSNGEIWVFDKNHTEYIPLSVSDLRQWMGKPTIVVLDCSNAGILIPFLTCPVTETPPNTPPRNTTPTPVQQQQEEQPMFDMETAASHWVQDTIVLCPTSESEWLPMHPDYPADIFTSCLTTPIQIALRWFVRRNRHSMGSLNPEAVDAIPGQANDRKTPLGELNWIFTAVTDSIAWNVLPKPLFQRLFRQDLLVASMFRNFLVADRILRSLNCTPQSYPPLPPGIADHPLWQAWDLACETCLFGLISDGILGNHVVKPPPTTKQGGGGGGEGDDSGGGGGGGGESTTPPTPKPQAVHQPQPPAVPPPKPLTLQPKHNSSTTIPTGLSSSVSSPFFSEQLTAFEIWLEHAAIYRNNIDQLDSPEQLPVVLQVLLSQVHRIRALELLRRFLELGPWAVNLALSLGIFPYVMKLLQSPEYKTLLVNIWASILYFDPTCQVDLVKDGAMPHFIQPLMLLPTPPTAGGGGGLDYSADSSSPAKMKEKQRALASFCLAATCYKYPQAKAECLRQNLHGHCCALLATYDKAKSELIQQQQQQQDAVGTIQSQPIISQTHMLSASTRVWLCLSIANLVQAFPPAQREAYNQNVHVCLLFRLKDDDGEVRAAASFALGCLLEQPPDSKMNSAGQGGGGGGGGGGMTQPPTMSIGPQGFTPSAMPPPPAFQPGIGPIPGVGVQGGAFPGQQVLVPQQHMSAATMNIPAALSASAVLSGQLRGPTTAAYPGGLPSANLPQPTNNPMWHPTGLPPPQQQLQQQQQGVNPPQAQNAVPGAPLVAQTGHAPTLAPQLQHPRLQLPAQMNPPQMHPPQLQLPQQQQPGLMQQPQQQLRPQQLQPQIIPRGSAAATQLQPPVLDRRMPGAPALQLGGPQGAVLPGPQGMMQGPPQQGMLAPQGMMPIAPPGGHVGMPGQILPQPLLQQQNLLRARPQHGGPMMPQMMGRPLVGGGDNPVPFMGAPMNPMIGGGVPGGSAGHPGLMMGLPGQQPSFLPESSVPRRRPTVYEDRRRLELDLGIAEALVKVLVDGCALARYESLMAIGNFVSKYTEAFLLVAEESSSSRPPDDSKAEESSSPGGEEKNRKPIVSMPQGMNRMLVDRFADCWKALRATQHKEAHPKVAQLANTIVSVIHEQLLDLRMEREKEEAKESETEGALSGIKEEGEPERVASVQNMSTPPREDSNSRNSTTGGIRSDGPAHRLQPKGYPLRRTATDPNTLSQVSSDPQQDARFNIRSPQGVPPLIGPTSGSGNDSKPNKKTYSLRKSEFYEWKKNSFKLHYEDLDDCDRGDRDPLNPASATRAYRQRRNAVAREAGIKLAKHFEILKPKPPKRRKVDILFDSDEEGDDKDSSLKVELKLKESKLLRNTGVNMTSMLKFHACEDILSVCDNEDGISIWDYEKGIRRSSFRNGNPKKSRMTTAFWINESSNSLFFVGCDDGSARVWDGIVESHGQVSEESPSLAATFFAIPNMDTGRRESGLICEWQQQSGTLIAGGNSSSIRCWDLASEKCSRIMETDREAPVTALTTAWDDEKGFSASGYQGIGPNIVVAGHGDGTLKVFDIRAPNPAASFNNGGRRFRSANNTFKEHRNWIVGTFFTSYGGRYEIVSGSVAGDIRAWDLRMSSSLRTLDVQRSPMTALAVHKQIPIAATGSYAQFIKIVTMEGEALQVARFHEEMSGQHRIGPVSCLEFHKNKLVLAAGATNSLVSIYKPKFPLKL